MSISNPIPTKDKAWVARTAKQPMVLETLELGKNVAALERRLIVEALA